MPPLREEPPKPASGHWRAELTAGLTHIGREPGLRRLVAACAIAFLVVGLNESVFFALLGSLQFFDMIPSLTGGGPLNTTHTMVSFLYYFGVTRMKVGFGSAVGLVLFIVCVAIAFSYKRILMKDD